MSGPDGAGAIPRPEPPGKAWIVVNPLGVRWQARFHTSRAAWMRAMARSRTATETPNEARERLRAAGWLVKRE